MLDKRNGSPVLEPKSLSMILVYGQMDDQKVLMDDQNSKSDKLFPIWLLIIDKTIGFHTGKLSPQLVDER